MWTSCGSTERSSAKRREMRGLNQPRVRLSLLSDSGVALEEISRLVGHSSTAVTEIVYRKQIRPVLQTGAVAMDRLFGGSEP